MVENSRTTVPLVAAAAALLSLLVYLPALANGFVNLDDPYYITNNPLIKSLDIASLGKLLTTSHLGAWLPLTYLSFAVDYHFWGDNPFGYHLTNLLLHGFNAMLVVLLAHRICRAAGLGPKDDGKRDVSYPLVLLAAGLLFSLHPLRVESVAWATERKDVLSGLPVLAAVLCYCRYVRLTASGEGGARRWAAYLGSFVLFILSLMAKQVSVTLPVVLLLLDWYPFDRLRRDRLLPVLLEKVPFFAVSLAISWLTLYLAVKEKMLIPLEFMPFLVRLVVSGNALFEYCRYFLFPVDIGPYFVLPKPLPSWYLLKAAVIVAVTLLIVRRARRFPGTTVVWCCYLVVMAPMLSFIQAGDDITIACRYTYLPMIAPAIGIALALRRLAGNRGEKGGQRAFLLAGGCTAVFLAVATVQTLRLIPVWRDTGSFWSRVIEVEPVGRAYGDRGVFSLINGNAAAALADFDAAVAIAERAGQKSIYNLYAFRGVALSDLGRFREAIVDFDRAIQLLPHPTYYQARGKALQAVGRFSEAAADFRRAGANPPPIDWF